MFDLKPCPFCGGKAQLFVLKEGGVCVVCKSCDNKTSLASDFDYSKTDEMTAVGRSIARWNRRIEDDKTAAICDDKVSTLWRGKGNEIRITTENLLSDEQCRGLYTLATSMSITGKTVAELYKTDEEERVQDGDDKKDQP